MIAILGYVVVIISVLGGFALAGGKLGILIQPAEFIIIFGAAMGSLLIASTKNTLRLILGHLPHVFSSREYTKRDYMEMLTIMGRLLSKARREGLASVESDIERPLSSGIFMAAKHVNKDKEAVAFICDTFRIYLMTGDPLEIESLMRVDIDSQHVSETLPASNISKMAESMPGMGIVAAVMGVVLTMAKINAPPEELGHSIGAALIGTFLGVLLCYGFIGPLATNLENRHKEREAFFMSISACITGAARGAPPLVALEHGRRAIPYEHRPSFTEMESLGKG